MQYFFLLIVSLIVSTCALAFEYLFYLHNGYKTLANIYDMTCIPFLIAFSLLIVGIYKPEKVIIWSRHKNITHVFFAYLPMTLMFFSSIIISWQTDITLVSTLPLPPIFFMFLTALPLGILAYNWFVIKNNNPFKNNDNSASLYYGLIAFTLIFVGICTHYIEYQQEKMQIKTLEHYSMATQNFNGGEKESTLKSSQNTKLQKKNDDENGQKFVDCLYKENNPKKAIHMLQKGLNANARYSQFEIPILVEAAGYGNSDVVRALISYGADINIKDSDGSTALMTAAALGHYDILNILLNTKRIDINARDNSGKTALQLTSIIKTANERMGLSTADQNKTMNLLINKGAK